MVALLAAALFAAAPLRLDETNSVKVRAGNLSRASALQPAVASSADWTRLPDSSFAPMPTGARLSFGHRAPPTLLRVVLDVPRSGRWWFVSELRTPKRVELRLGRRPLGLFGDDLPFDARPVATTDLSVPLRLEAPRETLYAMVSEPRGPCDVGFRLVPDAAFAAETASKASRDSWVAGYMSAIFLVAVCLWLAVREPAFAWYTAYFAGALLWLLAKRGLGFQHLWPELPWLNAGASLFAAHAAEGAFALFLRDLLRLRERRRTLDRFLLSMGALQIAVAPLLLFDLLRGPVFRAVESIQALLPLCLLATLAVCAWRDRNPLARKLLLAFLPLGLAMIHGTLVEFGIGPGGPATKASIVTIAALVENTLATLILLAEVRSREKARLRLEREFHARVVAAEDETSRDFARELHDGIGQRIYALRMRVFSRRGAIPAEFAGDMDAALGELHDDLRRVSRRIHPTTLRGRGLVAAAAELRDELAANWAGTISFCADGVPADLPESVATHFYRILQESLVNALRHSGAGSIDVLLGPTPDGGAFLQVDDDGAGLDAGNTPSPGLGLSGIRSRALALGGTAEIGERPGGGTRIAVRVPGRMLRHP